MVIWRKILRNGRKWQSLLLFIGQMEFQVLLTQSQVLVMPLFIGFMGNYCVSVSMVVYNTSLNFGIKKIKCGNSAPMHWLVYICEVFSNIYEHFRTWNDFFSGHKLGHINLCFLYLKPCMQKCCERHNSRIRKLQTQGALIQSKTFLCRPVIIIIVLGK